jgi:hypothetical protein
MTNEEFMNMVHEEIKKIDEEIKVVNEELSKGLSEITAFKYNELKHQSNLLITKRNGYLKFVNLPEYLRIQTMSDIELEQYRNEKLQEIDLDIFNGKGKLVEFLKIDGLITVTELTPHYNELKALNESLGELADKRRMYNHMSYDGLKELLCSDIEGFQKLEKDVEEALEKGNDVSYKMVERIAPFTYNVDMYINAARLYRHFEDKRDLVIEGVAQYVDNDFTEENLLYEIRGVEDLLTAASFPAQAELIERVRAQAQVLSDMKEALLRGISLDELHELKEDELVDSEDLEDSAHLAM